MAKRSVVKLALVGLLGLGLVGTVVLAPQTAYAEPREKPETTKGKALSAASFEQIEKSQECLAREDYNCAIQILNALLANPKLPKIQGHGQSMILAPSPTHILCLGSVFASVA